MDASIGSSELLLVFVVLLGAYVFHLRRGKKSKEKTPPGPSLYQIILTVLQLGRLPHILLRKWAKEYGPIIGFKLGSERVVVVTEAKLAKQLFSDMRACGRTRNPVFDAYSNGNFGIGKSHGTVWIEQRRFAMRTLKGLGFSKSSMEVRTLEEASRFLAFLKEREGQLLPGKGLFHHSVLNIIWSIVSGERSGPETTQIANDFIESLNRIANNGLLFVPLLRFLAPELTGFKSWMRNVNKMQDMINDTISKRASALDPDEPGDFIGHYLRHMNTDSEIEAGSSFSKENGRKNLNQAVVDFFVAGSETTSTILEFLMMYMSFHTEVQGKVQAEIDKVIGRDREPSLSNKTLMPFTEAVILEILRVSSLFPLNLPHTVLEDMEFRGYTLRKGTILLVDIFNIFHDPKIWGDNPNSFQPERHLDESGKILNCAEYLIAFGTGKRQCPGESVAMDSLFLFVTSIFQNFTVEMDPSSKTVDWDPIYGAVCKTKPFNVVVKAR